MMMRTRAARDISRRLDIHASVAADRVTWTVYCLRAARPYNDKVR